MSQGPPVAAETIRTTVRTLDERTLPLFAGLAGGTTMILNRP